MQFDPLLPAATTLCFDVYGRICSRQPRLIPTRASLPSRG